MKSESTRDILAVSKLSKGFGGLKALQNVNFSIQEGEIVGLIGPNGAGKTTMFNLISGFYKPTSGTIRFLEHDLTQLRADQICTLGIARTFQIVRPFLKTSVLDNVMLGCLVRERSRSKASENALHIIAELGLEKVTNRLGRDLTLVERKRLEVARALATSPKLLLLDEVMAGLNPREKDEVIGMVRKIHDGGVTLFIIEHSMKVIMALSQRIIVLHYGEKIGEGTPHEIQRDPVVIKAYLGKEN